MMLLEQAVMFFLYFGFIGLIVQYLKGAVVSVCSRLIVLSYAVHLLRYMFNYC